MKRSELPPEEGSPINRITGKDRLYEEIADCIAGVREHLLEVIIFAAIIANSVYWRTVMCNAMSNDTEKPVATDGAKVPAEK